MQPDLPPELLSEISYRIHDAADLVRFHAVCKPWRESYDPTKTTDQLLPNKKGDSLKFRCVFSNSSYLAPPPPIYGTGNNWVARADGTALRYITAGPALTDPLTGDVIDLPRFPDCTMWHGDMPSGVIYDDGTILLYSKYGDDNGGTAEFGATLLCPGDDDWTVVRRTLELPYDGEFCVAYHAGKIFVTVDERLWHVVTAASNNNHDVLVPRPSSMPRQERDGYYYEYGYVLESRGELLWASLHINKDYPEQYGKDVHGLARALSVSMHALEEADSDAPHWVWKEGVSLADRVLFLGCPNSFAVDASRIGMRGGFAYFMYCDADVGPGCMSHEQGGVFRYNLIDNTTEFVEWLHQGWGHEMCTWLLPRPTIGHIH